MSIVFVVLESFPHDLVSPDVTPTLWRLIDEGGWASGGGVAETPTVGYTNHATFMTGRSGVDHGLVSNLVPLDGEWIPAAEVGPEVPTVFDACRAEGLRSAAVVGDPNLLVVCGAEAAEVSWPAEDEVSTADAGRVADGDVVDAVCELDVTRFDFVFVQLDQLDGVRRRFGALSSETEQQCRATDEALGRLVARFESVWNETTFVVVGSRDLEDVGSFEPIDLKPMAPHGVMVAEQGTAAMVIGSLGPADLLGMRGVAGYASLDVDHHVVWGRQGQVFGAETVVAKAGSGSPRTDTQLAVVGGGDAGVAALAARLDGVRPPAQAWASWLAEALGLRWRPEESQC